MAQLNITLKYFAIIPMALLFIVATNPSEFAASLNKIGVNAILPEKVDTLIKNN